VGHEVAHGGDPRCRPEPVGPGGAVEGLEDLQAREGGQVFLDGIVEPEPALLDELHRGGRGDRLGHRRDAEQRICRQRPAGRDIGFAERALVQHPLAIGRHGDHAGKVLVPDRLAQLVVEAAGWLLGAGDRRPCRSRSAHHCAADQGHEFPSFHRSNSGSDRARRGPRPVISRGTIARFAGGCGGLPPPAVVRGRGPASLVRSLH
jgi:hypothetical protein